MSITNHPNIEHYAYEQAPEFNHYLCKIIDFFVDGIFLKKKNISLAFGSKTKLDIEHLTRGSSNARFNT